MSLAGVRSSQGDSFQTLVATRYAVEMIYTPELLEIEVDSTSLDRSGNPTVVDDVVVRYRDSILHVQAKKNQTDFKAWSIAELGDELKKAWTQWSRDSKVRLLFISRNNFGDVAKLKEHATTQPTPEAFERSLTDELRSSANRVASYSDLPNCFNALHSFLLQLNFETINRERFTSDLLGVLRLHVAHAENAFEKIKARLDAISRRDELQGGLRIPTHSLDRDDLFELLRNSGIEVCLPKADREAARVLTELSQIGRNWQRSIGGALLSRSVVGEILDKVSRRPSCLLVEAGPGMGKTCVLLSVLESLEQNSSVLPVFIQAREFAAARTPDEHVAMGLPQTLAADVARLSETRHIVILIDSLDVLSIARDHHALFFILSVIDRLRLIPNVTVIAACRSFDLKYDARLADRNWSEIVAVGPLDWECDIIPVLSRIGVDPDQVPADTRELLHNPRQLAIFHDIVATGIVPIAQSSQELTEQYLQRVVRASPMLGDVAMGSMMEVARWMLDNRRLDIPVVAARMTTDMIRALCSVGIMVETHQRALAFAHQTLLDVLAVAHANARGETIATFIRTRAAAPFIRPTVRAFLFSLRADDAVGFLRQVREVVDAHDIAFHLRRLVAESLADVTPIADDWPLVRNLFRNHTALFNDFYRKADGPEWLRFFHSNWLELLVQTRDGPWLVRLLERMGPSAELTQEFIRIWRQLFDWEWIDQKQLRWLSSQFLDRFQNWKADGLREIFVRLTADAEDDHGSLGKPLSKWVLATDSHDDLLWRYITRRVGPVDFESFDFGRSLECHPHTFIGEEFLNDRLQSSEALLDLVLNDVEVWSERRRRSYEIENEVSDGFLRESRHGRTHSSRDIHHADGLTVLLSALEDACKHHAEHETPWWRRNFDRLRNSRDVALRFFALQAIRGNPEVLATDASAMLLDETTLTHSRLRWEVGLLLNAAFPYLKAEQQDEVQELAIAVDDDDLDECGVLPKWRILAKRDLVAHIPISYRTREVQAIVELGESLDGPFSRYPKIESWGGMVRPPVPQETLVEMSDDGLVRLIRYYSAVPQSAERWERDGFDDLVGGANQVVSEVQVAASRQPIRFMRLYEHAGPELESAYVEAILAGIATHLRYRFGNLGSSEQWSAVEEPDGVLVARWLLCVVESNYDFWVGRRDMATILQAAAAVLESDEDSERIAFLLFGCLKSADPAPERIDTNNNLFVAINSTRGVATEATFALVGRRLESARVLPTLLVQVLNLCASDTHPSVRALVLRSLPVVLHYNVALGWHLFARALGAGDAPVWRHAYSCLYHNYYRQFSVVSRYLAILRASADPEALELWSRISALSCLAGHVDLDAFLADLKATGAKEAWSGAASIFAANIVEPRLRESCTRGLLFALNDADNDHKIVVEVSRLFLDSTGCLIDMKLVEAYFTAVDATGDEHGQSVHGVGSWLASVSVGDPEYALLATEEVLRHSTQLENWDGSPYAKLMTALFREAEELELSDHGQFLSRVVLVQDQLLQIGMHSLETWLQDAERP